MHSGNAEVYLRLVRIVNARGVYPSIKALTVGRTGFCAIQYAFKYSMKRIDCKKFECYLLGFFHNSTYGSEMKVNTIQATLP